MSFDTTQYSYTALRGIISERTMRATVWCGAGLSVPAGLPTWAGLRSALSEALRNKRSTMAPHDPARTDELIRHLALEPSSWIAFERFQSELGNATYSATIRDALRPAIAVPIPRIYSMLWQLRPAGFMNLNLDQLATRAYHETYGGKALAEFDSQGVGGHAHVLQGFAPFVYNMHGIHEDTGSWVLTHDQLRELTANEAYTTFVASVLTTSVGLFIGLSADDVAVGGHLERLVRIGIRGSPHFWVTSRSDAVTDRWAENAGIRVIRYRASDGSHVELEEMLEDLLSFTPPELQVTAPPVVAPVEGNRSLLSQPNELVVQDAETIRRTLNREAGRILARDDEGSFKEFTQLVATYDEAVHRAWYVSLRDGANLLMGYYLLEEVARGAFGRVFKATGSEGHQVAIKLLHSDLRERPELLLAFRRGVRAMSILRERGVKGVVTYESASEIPAFVAMEWVEGANLTDAVRAHRLKTWRSALRVGVGIAEIVDAAHRVPERVLHRDLRPANIMLKGLWASEEWSIVILDFDLSWHQGAYQQSVIHGSGTAGYLAPEQIRMEHGISARHASVDTFGLGMTLYFLVSAVDPLPAEHRHADWATRVSEACNRMPGGDWRSLPARFGRLIVLATKDRQADRLDLTQALAELRRLLALTGTNRSQPATDLITEELAARTHAFVEYLWDNDRFEATVSRPSGLTMVLSGDESAEFTRLSIRWSTTGTEDWGRMARRIPMACDTACAALTKVGWRVVARDVGREGLRIEASISDREVWTSFGKHADAVDRAASALRFQ